MTTERRLTLSVGLLVWRPNHGGDLEPNLIQISGLEMAHWIKMFSKCCFVVLSQRDRLLNSLKVNFYFKFVCCMLQVYNIMVVLFCRYNFAAQFRLGPSLLHWKCPSFLIKGLQMCRLCGRTQSKKGWEALNVRLWANNMNGKKNVKIIRYSTIIWWPKHNELWFIIGSFWKFWNWRLCLIYLILFQENWY